jgi:hypothetical protein
MQSRLEAYLLGLLLAVAACGGSVSSSGPATSHGDAGLQAGNGATSCAVTTCAAKGKNCGTMPDGCGGTLTCGSCTTGQTCGGGGSANVCGKGTCKTSTTCAAQKANCGMVSDGCSAVLDCGTCSAPKSCGGGGTPNMCGGSSSSNGGSGATAGNAKGGGAGGSSGAGGSGGSSNGGGGSGGTDSGPVSPPSTDLIPADSYTKWVPGMMSKGGIPNRTMVCATIQASAYGNGSQEASNAIQSALDACPVGQVVQLSAGTFLVNNFVNITKGITLRGAGAGMTFVKKTNGAKLLQESSPDQQPFVVIGANRWPGPDSTSQDLSEDGAKGADSVTVGNAAGFAAGQFVILDELSGAQWMTDPLGRGQIWAAPDWRVTWAFHKPADSGDDPLMATTPTSGGAAGWFSRQDRVTSEIKEIASVSGKVVTFTSPLHISYRKSHKAQLTAYTNTPMVTNAGVESLTATGYSDGCIRFEAAAYSWAKNVEVTLWAGEGVSFVNSFRVELRDSYIHDAAWPEPGGSGYAMSLAKGSSEILIENNISMMANKVMVARCSGAGSVVSYNYADDGFIMTSENWIEIGLNGSHMAGPHHILFEGNYGFNWDSDDTHGSSTYHTVFRNWLRGVRRPFVNPQTKNSIDDSKQSGNGPQRCAGAMAYSYWMTFVGNVLGASGQVGGYTYDATGPNATNSPAIWLLGWDTSAPTPYDPKVAATAVREGNWDWVQSKQSWQNVSAMTIPDSLYLSGKPAFFGSNPWPWVDPTTGATHTLPAKARFDANTPNAVP